MQMHTFTYTHIHTHTHKQNADNARVCCCSQYTVHCDVNNKLDNHTKDSHNNEHNNSKTNLHPTDPAAGLNLHSHSGVPRLSQLVTPFLALKMFATPT